MGTGTGESPRVILPSQTVSVLLGLVPWQGKPSEYCSHTWKPKCMSFVVLELSGLALSMVPGGSTTIALVVLKKKILLREISCSGSCS